MIESLIKLGDAQMREKVARLKDEKKALIDLLIQEPADMPEEPVMRRIVVRREGSIGLDEGWLEQVSGETCRRYMYVFEFHHPKRRRPRLTFRVGGVVIQKGERKGELDLNRIRDRLKQVRDAARHLGLNRLASYLDPIDKKSENMDQHIRVDENTVLLTVAAEEENGNVENLATLPEYLELLYYDVTRGYYKEGRYPVRRDGMCRFCGRSGEVVLDPDFPEGLLKLFIMDQPGPLSHVPASEAELEDALYRSFSICPDCLGRALVGYRFVEEYGYVVSLPFRRGDKTVTLRCYVIPGFWGPSDRHLGVLKRLADDGRGSRGATEAVTLGERIRQLLEDDVFLTFVFTTTESTQSQHVSLRGVIKDVHVSRIKDYLDRVRELREFFGRSLLSSVGSGKSHALARALRVGETESLEEALRGLLEGRTFLVFDLTKDDVGSLLPPREEAVIEVNRAILEGLPIAKSKIARYAVEVTRLIVHHEATLRWRGEGEEKRKSRLRNRYGRVLDLSILSLLYISLMIILDEMNGGNGSNDNSENGIPYADIMPEMLKELLSRAKLDEWSRSLVMLGYVMGRVGYEQNRERGRFDEFPPIFRSIRLEGMNAQQIQMLCNEVTAAMKNYGVTDLETTKVWSIALTEIQKNWSLSSRSDPVSNVFHIVVGYACATLKNIAESTQGKAGEGEGK